MRLKIAAFLLMITTAGLARAADVDSTLAALQDVGLKLKEFSGVIRLPEDDGLGNVRLKTGRVFFQRTADGSARIHVIIDKRVGSNGKSIDGEKTEYLLDGPTFIDRNFRTRSEVKRDILAKGQKLDLFKIGKGPFPLPIGQDPAEVKKQFNVKVVPLQKDEPQKSTHLVLTTKPDSALDRRFQEIDVWVDDVNHMPVRVDTVDKKGHIQGTELADLKLNPPGGLKDSDFALLPTEGAWDRSVENYHE